MIRRILLVVLCLVVVRAAPAAAQVKAEFWEPKLQAWIQAVESHVPGRDDAAAFAIGRWVNSDIAMMTPFILGLIEMLPPRPEVLRYPQSLTRDDRDRILVMAEPLGRRTDRTPFIRRAAMLHADVMLFRIAKPSRYLSEEQARRDAQARGRITILGKDGEPHGFAVMPKHWDFARELLSEVKPTPADDPFVRLWYRAATAFMLFELSFGEADIHLTEARRAIGPDAHLEFDTGCLHEAFASPNVTTVAEAVDRRTTIKSGVASQRESLEKAEEAFAEAVRLSPSFAEARVRLGRIMSLRGRHREAAEFLRQGGTMATDPAVKYIAAMFLGNAEQAAGNADAAAEAFDTAAALFPLAQSPHLARSALAIDRADRKGAAQALRRLLELPQDEKQRADPWWTYRFCSGRQAKDLLTVLWSTARRESSR